MGRMSCLFYVLLAVAPVIVHAGAQPAEMVTVKNLARAIEMFSESNPTTQIAGVDELMQHLGISSLDHEYPWLPVSQRYVFLKPGAGQVPSPGGGEVLVISALSLTLNELSETSNRDPAREQPGRYIIWKSKSGEVHFEWYPETEIRRFIKAEVLNAITLPKPKVSPHERISFDPSTGERIERFSIDPSTGEAIESTTSRPDFPLKDKGGTSAPGKAVAQTPVASSGQQLRVVASILAASALAVATLFLWRRHASGNRPPADRR